MNWNRLILAALFLLFLILMGVFYFSPTVRKKIETKDAPSPIGPYSQAIVVNTKKPGAQMLFISGQVPVDPKTGEVITEITQATHQVMTYLQSILKQANMDFGNVVKTTIFLTDLKDYSKVNDAYGSYFKNITILPARETVQVAALPRNSKIEISMIAAY